MQTLPNETAFMVFSKIFDAGNKEQYVQVEMPAWVLWNIKHILVSWDAGLGSMEQKEHMSLGSNQWICVWGKDCCYTFYYKVERSSCIECRNR